MQAYKKLYNKVLECRVNLHIASTGVLENPQLPLQFHHQSFIILGGSTVK